IMRMKKDEFESQLKLALKSKPKLSSNAELALLAQAEDLLAKRRERHASREALVRQVKQVRTERLASLRLFVSRGLELFTIYPDTPAAVTAFIVLILA